MADLRVEPVLALEGTIGGPCYHGGLMITVVVLAGLMMAADPPKQPPLTFERAVTVCTTEVQKAFPSGQFDSYLTGTNQVRWIGTKQEQFRFEKCMSQKGQPLDATK